MKETFLKKTSVMVPNITLEKELFLFFLSFMISPAKLGCQLQKGLYFKKIIFINMRNSLLQEVRKDVNQRKSHRLKETEIQNQIFSHKPSYS